MDRFEKMIKLLDSRYYSDLIVAVFELIAIITGLIYARKDKTSVFFLAYLIFDFLIIIVDYGILYCYFSEKEFSNFVCFTNTLISFAELLAYYHFFLKIIHSKNTNKLMKILRVVFSVIIAIFITTGYGFLTNRFAYVSLLIGVIELLFLVPPSFVYFYELLKNEPIIDLYKRPSFWIVTGIFFYSVVSIPDYLIERSVAYYKPKYWNITNLLLFSIPISINSIFLTKAFLCKKTLTI
ncbi:MAG: hypothetical protein Q8941_00200 [Bacteroidota bacterium]|nr:hypothetical protein [Bacteroidota bacterium]